MTACVRVARCLSGQSLCLKSFHVENNIVHNLSGFSKTCSRSVFSKSTSVHLTTCGFQGELAAILNWTGIRRTPTDDDLLDINMSEIMCNLLVLRLCVGDPFQ